MTAKKHQARSRRQKRRGAIKPLSNAAKHAVKRQADQPTRKSWLDRSLDLLKIGVGLANLFKDLFKP